MRQQGNPAHHERDYPLFARFVSRQALVGSFIARSPFTAACTKFSKFGGAQAVAAPEASAGRAGFFLHGAGRDARTVDVSISSPRRATAGVRMSIDRRLGPLFGLNAVRALEARAGWSQVPLGQGTRPACT